MAFPEMIARGLLERGESLGINKTVMNAVSELKVRVCTGHDGIMLTCWKSKRNLPDLAASLTRLPTSPAPTESAYAAYPLVDERPPAERPPWEPKTRFEMERDASDLRGLQKRLGDSVAWIVDTLLLDEESDDTDRIRERKREALECLSYVRDVLKGTVSAGDVEEGRLLGEEELKKRKMAMEERRAAEDRRAAAEAAEKLAKATAAHLASSVPTPPQPAVAAPPTLHARTPASMRRMPDIISPEPTFPRSAIRAPIVSSRAQMTRQKPPSPTPTVSVLPPNSGTNVVPLAPWNHTRSAFATTESPIATVPRMPSKPSAASSVRHGTAARMTGSYSASQTPPEDTNAPRAQPPPQDPLGVLR